MSSVKPPQCRNTASSVAAVSIHSLGARDRVVTPHAHKSASRSPNYGNANGVMLETTSTRGDSSDFSRRALAGYQVRLVRRLATEESRRQKSLTTNHWN